MTAAPPSPGVSTSHDLDPPPESPFARLADLRASLDRLATLPTAELDRLLTETLDACSHRLDVWVTAIEHVAAGQAARRASRPTGAPTLHLGGYGWVENVRPPPSRRRSPAPTPRRSPGSTTTAGGSCRNRTGRRCARCDSRPSDNGGFVHAPSMTQAAAGAVLRSGYLSHRATPDEPVLAIDLSSDRTRAALWLLDGVRQGLSLGALTGYQFEEQLHEAEPRRLRPAVPRRVPAGRRRADGATSHGEP